MSVAPPNDVYDMLHWQMVHAHNVFKTAFNSILRHLENPPKDDVPNFIGYCDAFVQAIDSHHTSEEVVVFPFLNRKMDFSGEAEAHKLIHTALDSLEASVREAKADPSKFDAEKMKTQMEELKDVLFSHLDDEVEHIKGSKIKEAGFQPAELKKMNVELETYAKSHGESSLLLPWVVGHIPPNIKPHWPGFPWVLRKFVIPWIIARKYSGYWKYSPYALS